MGQTQRRHVKPVAADADHTVTLKLMKGGSLTEWPDTAANSQQKSDRLLYLLSLQPPRIASSQAHRLRLQDDLAGGLASRNAGILARNPHFWDYLQQINLTAYDAEIDKRRARHFINRVCGVESRHDLDRHPAVSERFYTLIEMPFLDWLLNST